MLSRAGIAVWNWLEDIGQARANLELRMLADRWSVTNPELARQIRAGSSFDARSRGAAQAQSAQAAATPNDTSGSRS